MTRTLHVQRYVGAVLAALLLSACQSKPPTDASSSFDSAGKAVQRLAPSTLPLVTTPGTWLRPPRGPLFEPMDTLDPRNAMIYVYRPSTSWEDQELQAPTFFVDGSKVFGLKSGSYTWLELHAGTFQFYAKRPLTIFFIKKVFELEMTVEGGRNYYLRYSEDAPFDYVAEGLDPKDFMQAGFLQEVPESVALAEIASLKLDQQGVYFEAGRIAEQRWAPFETFPETGVDPDDVLAAPEESAPAEEGGWWSRTRSFFGNLF
ncbi:MAG: DUF2846 domain-containing protein [Pseudomonadota bacterium]